MCKILVTRPKKESEIFARRLRTFGYHVLVAPLLKIVLSPKKVSFADAQAILVSSPRALEGRTLPQDVPVLAVGDATARAARRCGAHTVYSAEGGIKKLEILAHKKLDPKKGPLTYLSGDVVNPLRLEKFEVRQKIVYEAHLRPKLPSHVVRALAGGTVTAALFFSARTARHFVFLVNRLGGDMTGIHAFCLSRAVGRAVAPASPIIWCAKKPTQDSLVELLCARVPPDKRKRMPL